MDESMLAKTGLAEVFWTAVVPNLSSLPPITDIDESTEVLKYTYPALIKLAKLWYPALAKRIPLFDNLVRDGVLYGMLFAGKSLRVAEVELQSLLLLVNEMGIHFVKHLKVFPVSTFIDKVCSSNVVVNSGGSAWE
jgi:Tti2 family